MKKYVVILSLLMLNIVIQAQYVIKADLFKQRIRQDTINEFPEWGNSQLDSTMIIVTKDSMIMFDNQEKDAYKLKSLLTRGAGINKFDGDKWFGVKWLGMDKSGVFTQIIIQKYDSETIVITITYGNVEYRYQCRPFKPNKNKLNTILK
jgi:hypothetical protein